MSVASDRPATQDSPAASETAAPATNSRRGLRRLLGGQLLTSLYGFLGGLVVAVAAPLILSALQEPPKRVVVQHPPRAVVETQREAFAEAGINPVPTPGMDNLGVSISADIVTSGYAGKTLVVDCEVYAVYPHPGFRQTQQISITGVNHPQVTAPCWIPLPPSQHPRRYNAVMLRVGPVKGPRQQTNALPVTPFVAPPVPSPQ